MMPVTNLRTSYTVAFFAIGQGILPQPVMELPQEEFYRVTGNLDAGNAT